MEVYQIHNSPVVQCSSTSLVKMRRGLDSQLENQWRYDEISIIVDF